MPVPLNPQVAAAFQQMSGALTHAKPESYDTGYVNPSDGLLNIDAAYGLTPPYIWVHYPLLRASTVAKNLAVPVQPGLPVLCAINRTTQELEVIGIDPVRGPLKLGGTSAASFNRPSTGASVNTDLLPGKNYLPGGIYPHATLGGMYVLVNDYPPINFLGVPYDLTANEPSTTGAIQWAVFYLIAGDATPYVATSTASTSDVAFTLPLSDALAVPIPVGAYRLFAVTVGQGQTDVHLSRFEDLRRFITPSGGDVDLVMMSSDGFAMVDANGFTTLRS